MADPRKRVIVIDVHPQPKSPPKPIIEKDFDIPPPTLKATIGDFVSRKKRAEP